MVIFDSWLKERPWFYTDYPSLRGSNLLQTLIFHESCVVVSFAELKAVGSVRMVSRSTLAEPGRERRESFFLLRTLQ